MARFPCHFTSSCLCGNLQFAKPCSLKIAHLALMQSRLECILLLLIYKWAAEGLDRQGLAPVPLCPALQAVCSKEEIQRGRGGLGGNDPRCESKFFHFLISSSIQQTLATCLSSPRHSARRRRHSMNNTGLHAALCQVGKMPLTPKDRDQIERRQMLSAKPSLWHRVGALG